MSETRAIFRPAGQRPASALVLELWDAMGLDWQPGPLIIYKPGAKAANAVKINLRLTPEWQVAENGNRFLKTISGGLFLDMPEAGGKDGDGNQTWAWQKRETLLTAKLGRKDIVQLRYAISRWRTFGFPVPFAAQPKPTAQRPVDPELGARTVQLFHKNAVSSTVITYSMDETGGILQLSTPKLRRSIKLDVFEEFDFLEYLANAHRLFTLTGKR